MLEVKYLLSLNPKFNLNYELATTACAHYNCLRALLLPAHSSDAVSFCSTYIPAATILTLHSIKTFTATLIDEATQPFTTVTAAT